MMSTRSVFQRCKAQKQKGYRHLLHCFHSLYTAGAHVNCCNHYGSVEIQLPQDPAISLLDKSMHHMESHYSQLSGSGASLDQHMTR